MGTPATSSERDGSCRLETRRRLSGPRTCESSGWREWNGWPPSVPSRGIAQSQVATARSSCIGPALELKCATNRQREDVRQRATRRQTTRRRSRLTLLIRPTPVLGSSPSPSRAEDGPHPCAERRQPIDPETPVAHPDRRPSIARNRMFADRTWCRRRYAALGPSSGSTASLPRLRSVGTTTHVCSSPGLRRRVSDGSSPKQSL
jgi:hypothetical protein